MTEANPSTILVTSSVVATIAHEAQASRDGTETGGILLGTADNDTLVIRHAGGPGAHATRRATSFQRDLHHAQVLGDWAFEHDQSIWIGEWHTHLRAPAAPSTRDLATYRSLLTDPELAFTYFVAIILVDPTSEWTHPRTATWLVTPARARPVTPQQCARPLRGLP